MLNERTVATLGGEIGSAFIEERNTEILHHERNEFKKGLERGEKQMLGRIKLARSQYPTNPIRAATSILSVLNILVVNNVVEGQKEYRRSLNEPVFLGVLAEALGALITYLNDGLDDATSRNRELADFLTEDIKTLKAYLIKFGFHKYSMRVTQHAIQKIRDDMEKHRNQGLEKAKYEFLRQIQAWLGSA